MNRDTILEQLRERILAFATLRVSKAQAEDVTQEVSVRQHDSDGSWGNFREARREASEKRRGEKHSSCSPRQNIYGHNRNNQE